MAKKPTLDGFVPRRSPGVIGDTSGRSSEKPQITNLEPRKPMTERAAAADTTSRLVPTTQQGLSRADIDESLQEIDRQSPDNQKGSRHKRGKKPLTRKRLIKRIVIAILVLLVLLGGFLAVKALIMSGSVFKGDVFGLIQQKKLKEDANGRSNILIFGTSEDDEGGDHPGALLTDSIMVLSVNQTKKNAYMVSIPRDLWVQLGDCSTGYQGKINELYNCYSNEGKDKEAGAKELSSKVAAVTGLDVQYYAHINYTVVREAVDAVGGVDVKIESSDPRGILDRNFDWKCNYKCYYVNYKNGEVAHMDGEHALAFMRARNAQGGYGLSQSNFDREQNQQKVVSALREKAMSAGVLTNPARVTALMNAMQGNLNTNFEMSEVRTLVSLATEIKSESIQSIVLNKEGEAVMTTGVAPTGGSIVRPVAGMFDYDEVAAYIKKQITSEAFMKEGATVVVLNGSGVAGAGQTAADKLSGMGFTVVSVSNAPEGSYTRREVYQKSESGFTATRAKLKSLYGSVKTGTSVFPGAGTADFVVIVGPETAKNAQ